MSHEIRTLIDRTRRICGSAMALAILLGAPACLAAGAKVADAPVGMILQHPDPNLQLQEIMAGETRDFPPGDMSTFVHYASCKTVTLKGGSVRFDKDAFQQTGGTKVSEARRCSRKFRVLDNLDTEAGGTMLRGPAPTLKREEPVLSIGFSRNAADIMAQDQVLLDELIGRLTSSEWFGLPHHKIVAVGHANDAGSPAANEKLSRRRAQAVADYLRGSTQIPKGKLKVAALGAKEPLPQLPASAEENRRVEIRLIRGPAN